MPNDKVLRSIAKPFRIDHSKGFRLADCDPGATDGLAKASKAEAAALLRQGISRLAELQEMLYAHDRFSLLLIFQAMDAAGKDSTIKHVMSGINPQGCQVFSFKAPSPEELDHDFLWRTTKCLPERGRIGIFNRSYYEEVLVVRVHPQILAGQRLPERLIGKKIWEERFQDIRAFERHMVRSGTVILKFFLNVSKEQQRRRFLERIEMPAKNWKFSPADVAERSHWKDYQKAYEEMIRATATRKAPWYVVPADTKWFTRLVVAAAVVDALESLDLAFPTVDAAHRAELDTARAALEAEATALPRRH